METAAVSESPVPETEVKQKATRRHFTGEYKKRFLDEAARCTQEGELGELLRREGIYWQTLSEWRQAYRERGEAGLQHRKRGPKPKSAPEAIRDRQVAELERRNAKLQSELERAKLLIEVQKKVSELLGVALPPTDEKS